MCLIIDMGKHLLVDNWPVPRIAEKPMVVYKMLISPCRRQKYPWSPCYRAVYKPNETKRSRLEIGEWYSLAAERVSFAVAAGLHAYRTRKKAVREMNKGLLGRCVIKVLIPKGAKYFVGADNDIVSDQFIIGNTKPVAARARR